MPKSHNAVLGCGLIKWVDRISEVVTSVSVPKTYISNTGDFITSIREQMIYEFEYFMRQGSGKILVLINPENYWELRAMNNSH